MIAGALALDARLDAFAAETAGLDDEALAAAWRRLLTEVQGWL